jgi:NADP-dependent 3-hydroxy acid dehydrogenase YdfG
MSATDKQNVWLITGCTSGLGRAIAETVLGAGYRAVVTALKLEDVADIAARFPETALTAALDVTNRDQAFEVVAQGEARFGSVDVLVNNAGFGFMGAVEESAPAEYRPMFDVNLFGTINMIQAVLPGMRARRHGHIMNISSVGGFTASIGFGLYAAAKFGVEAVSESLTLEVKPLGINVSVIEPGQFRTNFRGSSMSTAKQMIEDYAETVGKTRDFIGSSHGTQHGDPVRAAEVMIKLSEMENPPFRMPLGGDAYQRVRAKLAAVEKDIAAHEELGTDVNFPGLVAKSRL